MKAIAFIGCACIGVLVFILARAAMLGLSARRTRRRMRVEDILENRALSFALFAAVGLVLSSALSWKLLPVMLAIAACLAFFAPRFVQRRSQERLREECESQLDTLADIVAMGVRAGLSFDAAVGLYCQKFSNTLSKELGNAHLQWTRGVCTREEALGSLAARLHSPSFEKFVQTAVHAIRHGSPLAGMLTRLAADLRRDRRTSIERQVAKAPVKMLLPTGLLILPAMLLLVMGPVVIQFLNSGF